MEVTFPKTIEVNYIQSQCFLFTHIYSLMVTIIFFLTFLPPNEMLNENMWRTLCLPSVLPGSPPPHWSVFEHDSFSGGEPAQTDALCLLGTLQDHRTGIWTYRSTEGQGRMKQDFF